MLLIAYGNLRGIREAGPSSPCPTYFFIANMAILMVVGAYRAVAGIAPRPPDHRACRGTESTSGRRGAGCSTGPASSSSCEAFASGGSALTGTEAISNGVSVFRRPESRNARITMVLMATDPRLARARGLLARLGHPPGPLRVAGTPTVISQVGKYVYGTTGLGNLFYVLLQVGTTLILILAANTSFTGFPFLASFAAEDSYLPRQLTTRGHRLVFSTGIIVLTVVSVILLHRSPGPGWTA